MAQNVEDVVKKLEELFTVRVRGWKKGWVTKRWTFTLRSSTGDFGLNLRKLKELGEWLGTEKVGVENFEMETNDWGIAGTSPKTYWLQITVPGETIRANDWRDEDEG